MTWRCSLLLHKTAKDTVILESSSPPLLPSPVSPFLLPFHHFLLSLGLILSNVVSEWHCISRLFSQYLLENWRRAQLSFKTSSVSFIHNCSSTPAPEDLKELDFPPRRGRTVTVTSPSCHLPVLLGWLGSSRLWLDGRLLWICSLLGYEEEESFWTLVMFLMLVKNKNSSQNMSSLKHWKLVLSLYTSKNYACHGQSVPMKSFFILWRHCWRSCQNFLGVKL